MKKIILLLIISLNAYVSYSQDTLRIFFDINSSEISTPAKLNLDSLIQNVFSKISSSVSIVGYADYLGSKDYNKRLSKTRAVTVKEVLIKALVKKERITSVAGRGEQAELKNDPERKGNINDRRVDIIYQNGVSDFKQSSSKKLIRKNELSTHKETSIKESVDKLQKGETMVFENLNFEGGRHYLLQDSYSELKKLLNLLNENSKLKIEIQGHICCDDGNIDGLDFDTNEPKLSENRAKFVYDYLVKKGIDSSRLQYVGFGRRKPIVQKEETEEDRKTNRRVEIKILEK